MSDDVPFITDNGNYILDCQLNKQIDPYQFHEYLIHLTGVLETDIFKYNRSSYSRYTRWR